MSLPKRSIPLKPLYFKTVSTPLAKTPLELMSAAIVLRTPNSSADVSVFLRIAGTILLIVFLKPFA